MKWCLLFYKHTNMIKINNLLKTKFPKIIMFIIIDIIVLALASFFAIGLRFDFEDIPATYFINSYKYLFFDSIIMVLLFAYLRLYTSVWSYASIVELINVVIACLFTEAFCFGYKMLLGISMPRSYYIIQVLLLIIGICGIRYSYRIARTIYTKFANRHKHSHTMIIGGGEAARLLIDEIARNQSAFETRISCIIDDNKNKIGSYIRGIPVVGDRRRIEVMSKKYNIKDIIIAIPSASKDTISKIVIECQKTNCNIKILPSIILSMNEKKEDIIKSVRPLSYEDFLGRDQIIVDSSEIVSNIQNKTILVTGGGGSIGSELCRQIAKCCPKSLIIFDIYENNAYDIQQELLREYPELDLHTIIGSVRDYDRLERVFKDFKPNQVFHAAAHKHVPLMEVSPNEAIKNNCLGTLNT